MGHRKGREQGRGSHESLGNSSVLGRAVSREFMLARERTVDVRRHLHPRD